MYQICYHYKVMLFQGRQCKQSLYEILKNYASALRHQGTLAERQTLLKCKNSIRILK